MTRFLIVAHGSPSDPAPPEAALGALARAVAAQLGAPVSAATLAAPGALEAAVDGPVIVYPFFMAEGWFTRRELPRRLGGGAARILPPFGLEPALPGLVTRIVTQAAAEAGLDPARADLILAAHGSRSPGQAKATTFAMAAHLRRATRFWRVLPAFIEEPPFIADTAARSHGGLCLPFFALRASHVDHDIPEALRQAGFAGRLLPAVGEHDGVAALIAKSLRAHLPD